MARSLKWQRVEDEIWMQIERVEENMSAGMELGRELGDPLFVGLAFMDGDNELEWLRDDLRVIKEREARETEWEDHWLHT